MTKYATTFNIIFGAIATLGGVATALVAVLTFRETATKDLESVRKHQ